MGKLIIANQYGIAPNELLNRNDLSLKAKGLFVYMQSKPNGWKFSVNRISEQLKEGRLSISNTIKELENANYLKRTLADKKDGGKWDGYDYTLYEKPYTRKPIQRITDIMDNHIDNSNKDISNKDISNKDIDIITKKTEKFIKKLKKLSIKKSQIENLKEFASYWTEPNKRKTKLRWELERTWDTKRRLNTWLNNSDKWNKGKKEEKTLDELFDKTN